jgi:hypothetical protein
MTVTLENATKKRGRHKKVVQPEQHTNSVNITISLEEKQEPQEPVLKKRGRKPKGGKLIINPQEKIVNAPPIANIILHLKCSMKDLNEHNTIMNQMVTDPMIYNPSIPPSIMTYNSDNNIFSEYNDIEENNNDIAYNEFDSTIKQNSGQNICNNCSINMNEEKDEEADINIKDVNAKLKKLKIQLYKNLNQDKKSSCFWCTYEYDNPSCYIPKYEMDCEIFGYGSFCRPECAVAYLMKENIDDSTKFERYHLLNQLYSKVYDYKKNIKPAPNPYYLLDKFYGNLTIQEYRKLLKTENMLLIVEKPLTRVLPELHEDNDDFISNIYGGSNVNASQSGGAYKVKRESERQKGQSKTSIIKERFGISK